MGVGVLGLVQQNVFKGMFQFIHNPGIMMLQQAQGPLQQIIKIQRTVGLFGGDVRPPNRRGHGPQGHRGLKTFRPIQTLAQGIQPQGFAG